MNCLKEMKALRQLDCLGNPVTQRRVYLDYVKKQLPKLEELDSKFMQQQVPSEGRESTESSLGTEGNKPPLPVTSPFKENGIQVADLKNSSAKRFLDSQSK